MKGIYKWAQGPGFGLDEVDVGFRGGDVSDSKDRASGSFSGSDDDLYVDDIDGEDGDDEGEHKHNHHGEGDIIGLDANVPQARRRGEDQYGNGDGHKYPGRGDDYLETDGGPSWSSLINPDKIQGAWSSEDGPTTDEVYNWITDPRNPEGNYTDTFNMNDVSTDRGLAYANYRREIMYKIAAKKKEENKLNEEAETKSMEIRKDLGITLNAEGMPHIAFRDGSFAEVRKKVKDAQSRHQGVDADAEYIVVLAYPSLGFENEMGIAGYKNIKYAENMLANYARIHVANGSTYTP